MNTFPLDRRYQEDENFHAIVNRFSVMIEQCAELGIGSPSELRTALTYAFLRREMLSTGRYYIYDEKTGELRRGGGG